MPTIIENAADAITAVKKLREKSISYAIIDAAKGGTFDGCTFVGYDSESTKLVFEKSNVRFEISPFAFCQRKETNVAQAPTYEFDEGAMTGMSVGLDPVVAVVQWFYSTKGQLLKFRASRPKTVPVWNKSKGVWELRPNTTDLVVEFAAAAPAAPATPPAFPF